MVFSLVLLTGAVIFVTSLRNLVTTDLGFERDGLLVASMDALAADRKAAPDVSSITLFYQEVADRVRSVPGVASAALSWMPPLSHSDYWGSRDIGIDGSAPVEAAEATLFNAVSPGYFATMGMRILAGRDFAPSDDSAAAGVIIVNQSLAQMYFSGDNPIGRRISIGLHPSRQNLEIVGVVNDARYQSVAEPARRIAYLPYLQLNEFRSGQNLVAVIRGNAGAEVSESLRRAISDVNASVPVRIERLADRIDDSIARERLLAILALLLGGSSVILASCSVYGLLAHQVRRETREIGIRIAVGASQWRILGAVLKRTAAMILIGASLGGPIAWLVYRSTASLVYGVAPTDPTSILLAILVLMSVSLVATLIPARRAVRIDPVTALRSD
jgi:predicted permease